MIILEKFMPIDGSVEYKHLTDAMGVLVLTGPKSRALLNKVSNADFFK